MEMKAKLKLPLSSRTSTKVDSTPSLKITSEVQETCWSARLVCVAVTTKPSALTAAFVPALLPAPGVPMRARPAAVARISASAAIAEDW